MKDSNPKKQQEFFLCIFRIRKAPDRLISEFAMSSRSPKSKLLLTALLAIILNCSPSDLRVVNDSPCDLFTSQGICKEPWKGERIYTIPNNDTTRNLVTWEQVSRYLYFTARETPGVLIHFQRNLKDQEKIQLEKNCNASFLFHGTKQIMEGKEVGEAHLGFFQYLGTLIEEETKHRKIWLEPMDTRLLFPTKSSIQWDCGFIGGEIMFRLDLIRE